MASLTCTRVAPTGMRASASRTISAPRVAPRIAVTAGSERRALQSIVRAQDEGVAGKVTEKSSSGPAQLPQTGREAPMGENKKGHAPELGAAPEGDKAILGQKAQPTGQKAYSETPEERYGSGHETAADVSKDRTRKSELQKNDLDAGTAAGGGAAGEGSSA